MQGVNAGELVAEAAASATARRAARVRQVRRSADITLAAAPFPEHAGRCVGWYSAGFRRRHHHYPYPAPAVRLHLKGWESGSDRRQRHLGGTFTLKGMGNPHQARAKPAAPHEDSGLRRKTVAMSTPERGCELGFGAETQLPPGVWR